MGVKKLIERMRTESLCMEIMDLCMEAAEALSMIRDELEQVKKERDAAVEDLRVASIEGYMDCNWCAGKKDQTQCYNCSFANNWQWRGLKEG